MSFREYHHIDASVYLKAIEDEIKGDYTLKSNYLSKLGRTYGCDIAVHILGEITYVICRDSKDKPTRDRFLELLGDFVKKQNIKVITISEEDIRLFHELREIETRAHEPELLALAVAIRKGVDVFMTYDEDLLQSAPRFKEKYKIKVRRPI